MLRPLEARPLSRLFGAVVVGLVCFAMAHERILGGEENFATIRMFQGLSAPQPPPPGQPLAAGCVVGSETR